MVWLLGNLAEVSPIPGAYRVSRFELGNPRGFWEYSDEDFVLESQVGLKQGWDVFSQGLCRHCHEEVQRTVFPWTLLRCADGKCGK